VAKAIVLLILLTKVSICYSQDTLQSNRRMRGTIQLSATGKYLVDSATGKPVFITGEDAWSLSNQLDDSGLATYLADRASRGFNAIWVGAADNTYQSRRPANFFGYDPFRGPDFTHEVGAFWVHVDYVVRRAAAYGTAVFLDPGFVGSTPYSGYLTSYQNASASTLGAYGQFLGSKVRKLPQYCVDARRGLESR
jgi:hypothetical protein